MSGDLAPVVSRLEHVTVYAVGARVRRVVTLTGPLPSVVRITGLPLGMIDDSVRVEVDGPAVATAVRCGVAVPPAGVAADEDSPELIAARRRVALAEAEDARVTAALEAQQAAPLVDAELRDEPAPAWAAVVTARRALLALRTTREHALRTESATARVELDAARRALEVVVERDRRAGTARAVKLHEVRKVVELDLLAAASGPDTVIEIHVEYLVAAARWAPSYVARLDGDRVRFELRAVVAQASGEDWTGVTLVLSTAEPARFAMLPELAAQRIGRRQDAPARRGFRPPPTGARELYGDFDRAFASRLGRGGPPQAAHDEADDGISGDLSDLVGGRIGALDAEVWDEGSSRDKDAFDSAVGASFGGAAPPGGAPRPPVRSAPAPVHAAPPMPKSAPMTPMMQPQASMMMDVASASVPRGGMAFAAPKKASAIASSFAAPSEQLAPAAPEARLDYDSLRMPSPIASERGALVPAAPSRDALARSIAASVGQGVRVIGGLALPPGFSARWAHTYDYAFPADGLVEVGADGAWHSLPLTARPSTATVRHVVVPRERTDVYRVAAIANPLTGPLLPGPIDVYDRGQFLVTSHVDYTPPGAVVEIGLGVDATVKVARNTEFREEATGMLRGALRLHHTIAIDVDNLSGRAIDLEVRERVPVVRDGDDDVELTVARVEPAWERWTPDPEGPHAPKLRGGHRWRIALAAGAKRTLRAGYEIKIASKQELVGGNRRES